jgi:hypothetical protein
LDYSSIRKKYIKTPIVDTHNAVQQTLSFHTKKEGFAFSSQGAVLLPNKALQSFQNQQKKPV